VHSDAHEPLARVDSVASIASSATEKTPEERLKAEEEKKLKKFSVKESPKCALCGKSVYKMDETQDSKGTIFHKDCLRCHQCKASLIGASQRAAPPPAPRTRLTRAPQPGREPIHEEKRVGPLKTAQYLVAMEGTMLGNKGDLFCDKHAIKARASMVSGKNPGEIARDDGELKRVSSMIKEKKEEARASMEIRVGDSTPMCSRCGQPIDRGQAVLASGLQRFHEACPSKEEADKAVRTTRYFVKKAPDRLIAQLAVDSDTKLSFMYDIDRPTLHDQLRKKSHEPAKLMYVPDAQARAAAQRRIPEAKTKREFDIVLKDTQLNLTFHDPKTNKTVTPVLDAKEKELTVTKFHLTNGVLQTLVARFKYDADARVLAPEYVELAMEMWPPVEDEKVDDPLAKLKQQRADTAVEVDLAAEAAVKAQEALKRVAEEGKEAGGKQAAVKAEGAAAGAKEAGGGCCSVM
jgi:hypothetical protein